MEEVNVKQVLIRLLKNELISDEEFDAIYAKCQEDYLLVRSEDGNIKFYSRNDAWNVIV